MWKVEVMHLWQKLSRYTQGLILIMVSILFFSWGLFGSLQVEKQTKDIASLVARQHAEAEQAATELLERIITNGEFQSCVWHEVVRPKNVGNQKRTVRAIRGCERRYL